MTISHRIQGARWLWPLALALLLAGLAGCTPTPATTEPEVIFVTATPEPADAATIPPTADPDAQADAGLDSEATPTPRSTTQPATPSGPTATPRPAINPETGVLELPEGNVANDRYFASYCPDPQGRSDWMFELAAGRAQFECELHPPHVKGEGAGRISGFDQPYHVFLKQHLDYGAAGAVVRFSLDSFSWQPEDPVVGRPSQTTRPADHPRVRIGIGALGEDDPTADTIIWSPWYTNPLGDYPFGYTADDAYQTMNVNAVLQEHDSGRYYYFVEIDSPGRGWPRSDVFLADAVIEFTGYLGNLPVEWFDPTAGH